MFTFRPEAKQKLRRTSWTSLTWETVALVNNKQSSAKKRCEICGPFLETVIGSQTPSETFSWMKRANFSMRNRKRGIMGPLAATHVVVKNKEVFHCSTWWRVVAVMPFMMRLVILDGKPKSHEVFMRNPQQLGHKLFRSHDIARITWLMHVMHYLLGNDGIITCASIWNKTALERTNDSIKVRPNPVDKNFRHLLRDDRAETDRSKVHDGCWWIWFGDAHHNSFS